MRQGQVRSGIPVGRVARSVIARSVRSCKLGDRSGYQFQNFNGREIGNMAANPTQEESTAMN